VPYAPPFPARDELLTLAMLDLARERGVHDMSIRTLARAVRAAPGSLTYHHGDKDTMLATCARFLGHWLCRDMEDRLSAGGWRGLLPCPREANDIEDFEEAEYARRLRVWWQLAAYGLDSPLVSATVRAGEGRMTAMLDEHAGGRIEPAARLARWAAFRWLAMDLLQPGTELRRDAAAAALESVAEGSGSFSSDVRGKRT
jgi:AcrR family transcriptional regulator